MAATTMALVDFTLMQREGSDIGVEELLACTYLVLHLLRLGYRRAALQLLKQASQLSVARCNYLHLGQCSTNTSLHSVAESLCGWWHDNCLLH